MSLQMLGILPSGRVRALPFWSYELIHKASQENSISYEGSSQEHFLLRFQIQAGPGSWCVSIRQELPINPVSRPWAVQTSPVPAQGITTSVMCNGLLVRIISALTHTQFTFPTGIINDT